eukprot:7266129-Pyramimonas_sp.AAC.1
MEVYVILGPVGAATHPPGQVAGRAHNQYNYYDISKVYYRCPGRAANEDNDELRGAPELSAIPSRVALT